MRAMCVCVCVFYCDSTVGSQLPENIGTNGGARKKNIQITEHHGESY